MHRWRARAPVVTGGEVECHQRRRDARRQKGTAPGTFARTAKRVWFPWLRFGSAWFGENQFNHPLEKSRALDGGGCANRKYLKDEQAARDFLSTRVRRPRHACRDAFFGFGRVEEDAAQF